jgi:trimeric autotransporter adhesin
MGNINQSFKNAIIAIAIAFIFTPLFAQNGKDFQNMPASENSERSIREFLDPDGCFDLEAARRSGFQGSLNISGFEGDIVNATGQPVFNPVAKKAASENPDDIYWDNRMSSSIPGVNYNVSVFTIFNGKLIVGGYFTIAGGVIANYIAAWDGTSWSALGSGMAGGDQTHVSALTVFDGKLIAGGTFTSAGGVSVNNIAAWDGESWYSLGSGISGGFFDEMKHQIFVYALTVYDNKLIVGGNFTEAGRVSANYIASWDGTSWSPLGSGINGFVNALTVYNNKLVAAGSFSTAGGVSVKNIAAWDGAAWSPIGSGFNSSVNALTVYNGELIAGGKFTKMGDATVNFVAAWDGSSWSSLGYVLNSYVSSLTVYNRKLIAGGQFYSAGSVSVNYIASWNGTSWSALGSGFNSPVVSLIEYDKKLCAGGNFWKAGEVDVDNLAIWDGSSWSPLGSGFIPSSVNALTVYDKKIIAGRLIGKAGAVEINGIGAWDGLSWSSIWPASGSVIRNINAFTLYNRELIIGVNDNINASWDGISWSIFGGLNIDSFSVYEGKLFAGHVDSYTRAYVSVFNGSTWSPLGSGMVNGDYPKVSALTVYGNKLIAGGDFHTAGGVSANNIASWDGISWSSLGSGMSGGYYDRVYYDPYVYALTVYDNKLIVGGEFRQAGGVRVNGIAAWDGSTWSPLGSGMTGGVYPNVYALVVFDGKLIVGGEFKFAGGIEANGIAAWDGTSWSPLGSGVKGTIRAFTVFDEKLIVGGGFQSAGGKVAPYIAAWTKKDFSKEVEQSSLPSPLRLIQNYPNPFNPSTTIEFTILSSGKANLSIYDIMGRKVRELFSGNVSAEIRTVLWDGKDDSGIAVSSGVYIARLNIGKYTSSIKMLMMK